MLSQRQPCNSSKMAQETNSHPQSNLCTNVSFGHPCYAMDYIDIHNAMEAL